MKKSESLRFIRLANELIESLGAVRNKSSSAYEWTLKTKAGPLQLHVEDYSSPSNGPGTVCGCFDNLTRISDVMRTTLSVMNVNLHSGKWNHHFFDDWGVSQALSCMETRLKSIVILKKKEPHNV